MAEINPIRRTLLNYLKKFGLDGGVINPYDWSEEGYFMETQWDEVNRIRIPWPEGFNYNWFVQAFYVADREDFRLAGVDEKHMVR